MNRSIAISIALAACAAGNAFADDIAVDPNPFVSTASRAQVQLELRQFRASGLDPWADGYDQLAQFKSAVTRAEVRNEFFAARDSVAAFSREDSGSSYLARSKVVPRRAAIELAGGE